MYLQDFYIYVFTKLRTRRYDVLNFIPRLRGLTRRIALKHVRRYLAKPFKPKGEDKENIIVSFTSFPARINNVWQVVECMKRQSCRPEKILLWLSKDQFPTEESIPKTLREREDEQFEIRLVDGDIRSHKKYYYAFLEDPTKTIVTIDDDVYYHSDTLKILLECSQRNPRSVIANRTKKIIYKNGKMQPYSQWETEVLANASTNLVQIGVGGVLYPTNFYTPLLVEKETFLKLTPLADDLWLNAIARYQHVSVVQTDFKYLIINLDNGDAPALSSVNLGQSQNDIQVNNLQHYFEETHSVNIYTE